MNLSISEQHDREHSLPHFVSTQDLKVYAEERVLIICLNLHSVIDVGEELADRETNCCCTENFERKGFVPIGKGE